MPTPRAWKEIAVIIELVEEYSKKDRVSGAKKDLTMYLYTQKLQTIFLPWLKKK